MADDASSSGTQSPTPTGRPPGISEPLAGINSTDQSGLIAILAAFSLGLVFLAVSVRIFVRHGIRTYRVDDWSFFAASIFAIIQASLIFRSLAFGLGKLQEDIREGYILKIEKLSFAADLLYLTTLFLSKLSTSFLFLYLTPGRAHLRAIYLTIAGSVTWLVSSVILEAIRCHPNHPWTDDVASCPNSFARWIFIAVFDAIIEVCIVALAIYIVWSLQMSFGSKMIVVGAFACRIPNIALALLRLSFIHAPLLPSTSHTYSAHLISTTQLALGYSITASIIPYLKPFMMAYERPEKSRASHYPSSGSRSGGSHFKLSALTSKSSARDTGVGTGMGVGLGTMDFDYDDIERRDRDRNVIGGGGSGNGDGDFLKEHRRDGESYTPTTLHLGRLRPEATKYSANASAVEHTKDDEQRGDGASDDSQMMIIKKGVEWSVEYDERSARERGGSVVRTDDGEADEICVARRVV